MFVLSFDVTPYFQFKKTCFFIWFKSGESFCQPVVKYEDEKQTNISAKKGPKCT